jgi:hypothetical protein
LLEDKYGITDVNHYVRWPFGRTTIEMIAFAKRGGRGVLIVGSMKMNLEAKHFDQLKRWVNVVEERYSDVIVVQSHEWLAYPAE